MARRLRKLRIDRIDLVDKGANQHAHITLYKRAAPVAKDDLGMGADYPPRTVAQVLAEREAKDAWYELLAALECSVREITGSADPAQMPALLAQTVQEFGQAAKDLIPNVAKRAALVEAVANVEKAGRVIAGQRLTRIKDALAVLQQIVREAEPDTTEADMADADVTKRAEAAEAEAAALKKKLEEAEARLAKGDPETLAKRLEAAEQTLEVEKAKREEREYMAKAEAYQTLPIKPAEDWRVFKAIDAMEAPVRDRLLDLLSAADGQLARAGAFVPTGKRGERTSGASAWEEAQALADGLIAKRADLSKNAAIAEVWRERPDLYERHRKETQVRG